MHCLKIIPLVNSDIEVWIRLKQYDTEVYYLILDDKMSRVNDVNLKLVSEMQLIDFLFQVQLNTNLWTCAWPDYVMLYGIFQHVIDKGKPPLILTKSLLYSYDEKLF